MQTTINISLDVPQTKAKVARKQYDHDVLCGIMKTDKSDKEMIEEYLEEKYQI